MKDDKAERAANFWRVKFRGTLDEITRAHAARQLGHLGGASRAAVPELIDALESDQECIRQSATEALADIVLDGYEAALGLIRCEIAKGNRTRTAYSLEHIEARLAGPSKIDFSNVFPKEES